ncbi:MAG: FAD-binding oxidoreductase [Caldilineaceae bacterium]|nr:FAD-binding oxidoreductase [Caldilineaceae bacterium]
MALPLEKPTLAALKGSVRGTTFQPQDKGYDETRALYNGMIDKRPALIVRCADASDVINTVNFARETGLDLAVRGGGHNGAGLGSCNDGVVADLSAMRNVRVDPDSRTVRVEGGATWGDVDHAAHAFGLAVPTGIVSTTGVAGLTLGGGHGYLARKYGLTCDNLLEADVVLADGSFATANEKELSDLFWALRGGGGNFGAVTSFKFRAHPVHTVIGGPMLWDLDDAETILRYFDAFMDSASDDAYGWFGFLVVPPAPAFPEQLHLKNLCGIVWCHFGAQEEADKTLVAFRSKAKPVFEHVGPIPLPALNSLFDPLFPPGLQWYWKGDFTRSLTDNAIALHMKYGKTVPTVQSTMHFYPINGAPNRIGRQETAFSYREAKYSTVFVGVDPDPAKAGMIRKWARDYWQELHSHSLGGGYVNFMGEDEGQDRVRATYRDNYDRLARIKAKYDPANLFHVNQNIRPAA